MALTTNAKIYYALSHPINLLFALSTMSRSKKHKKPNIPPSTLARARLDAILDATGQEPEATANQIAALVREIGNEPVLGSFVKRFQNASPNEQDSLRELAARLGTDENRACLWVVIKRQGGMSDDAKRAAFEVLHAMGEETALDDLSRYLAPARVQAPSRSHEPPTYWKDAPLVIGDFEETETQAPLSGDDEAQIHEIIVKSAYRPPVEQFLYLGKPDSFDSRDYIKMGITDADIPELVRMATSRELNRAPFPSSLVWAPVHAWRALGQLRASEAVGPLLGLLKYIDKDYDEWSSEELPLVFGQIGPIALEPLGAYLADASNPLWARVTASESIHNIGEHFPETRPKVITFLMNALEPYAKNDTSLNAFIILALTRLRATEALPLIKRAFAADCVDEMLNGDWHNVQTQFGL